MNDLVRASDHQWNIVALFFDTFACSGVPVASAVKSLYQWREDARDAFLQKKLIDLHNGMTAALKDGPEVDKDELIKVHVRNLRNEYGDDHFNEILFNTVEKLNSSYMANLMGKAFVASARGHITSTEYFTITHALLHLTLFDINSIRECENTHLTSLTFDAQQRLLSVGFAHHPLTFGSAPADWNKDLVKKFFKLDRGRDVTQFAETPQDVKDQLIPPLLS